MGGSFTDIFIVLSVIFIHLSHSAKDLFAENDIKQIKGTLYPRESKTREVKTLDGIWNFVLSDIENPTQGIREEWFANSLSKVKPVIPMPVPASYNDITTDQKIRDHVGTVWYDRTFYIPKSWSKNQRVWIRLGSVNYEAAVWINGEKAVTHEIGHLPFEAEITHLVKFGDENRVTVLCDNALIQNTIPQGNIWESQTDDGLKITQSYTFDFFNYAGIHRSVHLFTTPNIYIEYVSITTGIQNTTGIISFEIIAIGYTRKEEVRVVIQIKDKNGNVVANQILDFGEFAGVAKIENVNIWWPYLMSPDPGYLYEVNIYLEGESEELIDAYAFKIGVRTLTWNQNSFLINDKPIYFRGFGRHEDSDIRGKGLDLALLARDFSLIKWIGANAYRTSHYPYSEESMQFADEHGIMIIDECPSVDTDNYNQVLMDKHKFSLQQLIHRDKNHPSVVMWSIANEPRTSKARAGSYFKSIAQYTRELDKTRPVTASIAVNSKDDKAGQYLDIISFNRYNGWYSNAGRLDMITSNIVTEATNWNKKCNCPILMSEYGADTIEGLHLLPSYVWSEEYQKGLFSKHFKAFDVLRERGWFIGEFVWNFADFKTAQGYTRVGGNKKGVFTRDRQPKAVAEVLRERYFALGKELDSFEAPEDLYYYIATSSSNNVNMCLSSNTF